MLNTKTLTNTILGTAVLCLTGVSSGTARAESPLVEEPAERTGMSFEDMNLVVEDSCIMCHSDAARTGGLTLESFDSAHVVDNPETTEKMIRKLRTGMMPPAYAPQPDREEIIAFMTALENDMDSAAESDPNPGRRPFQRLNRTEYANSVKGLLNIEVEVEDFLPPDTMSDGFDNIADVQTMSATLLDGYMRAAGKISREAVGDREASASESTYKIPRTQSQVAHVDGAPMGTRGGLSVVHNFPADGDYIFKVQLHSTPTGFLFGLTAEDEILEVSIDGARVATLAIDPLLHEQDDQGMVLTSEPVTIKAGPHRLSAAFLEYTDAPIDDLIAPIEHTLTDTTIGRAHGMTTLPHLRFFSINGPHNVTGISETPSRREIFICRPISAAEELPCAKRILDRIASKAYRRPVSEGDLEGVLSFYQAGRDKGDFESGIRTAIQAILASPYFVFRVEETPSDLEPATKNYRVSGLELASRLSFFIWGDAPDEELVRVAGEGGLEDGATLEAQVHRLMQDPRSEALATRFASQWLRLQDLEKLHPDALLYPQYDAKLAIDLERETQLFFDYIFREDRSVVDILDADYTFVNERVAKHYRIPNVTGSRFRRIDVVDEHRRGILGHASVLTLTAIADRTSPVQRGKWIMEVLLGSPPPPPPPNVDFSTFEAAAGGDVLSVREAMELHRSNPACSSCHSMIDPLGLTLENFDVTGAWRIKDNGNHIDASGELYDGTAMDGPVGLREALVDHQYSIITSFTESLLTYALGRRVEYYDQPTVRHIVQSAQDNENRISAFVLGIIKSDAFQMSRIDTEMTTDAPEAEH